MDKEQLLQVLSTKISSGEITYDEMMSRFNLTAVKTEVPITTSTTPTIKASSHFSVTNMLYVLGAVIVVVGIVLFTYQIWEDIGALGRISVTLGLGIMITAIGSILYKNIANNTLATVFHFIGGMLIPGGALVALYEYNSTQFLPWPTALTFGCIFVFYIVLNLIHKNPILTFFTTANGTAFLYLTVHAITDGRLDNYTNLYAYLTIIIGACYILLASSFKNTWNEKLTPVFYFFGFVGVQIAAISQYANSFGYYSNHSVWPATLSFGLIFAFYLFINSKLKNTALTLLTIANGTLFIYAFVSAIVISTGHSGINIYKYITMIIGLSYLLLARSFAGGWNSRLIEILNLVGTLGFLGAAFSKIFGSLPWQLFFLILVIGGFAFSVYVRSRAILVLSTLFLLSYVSYITSEYFADSIGWPVSLVILGFIFIALGYTSISINKKYIKN